HEVDVVRKDHNDVVGSLGGDEGTRLGDRVVGAAEPVLAPALLRRHRRHVVAQQRALPPRLGDVLAQPQRLVLAKVDHPQIPRVPDGRQRETDAPVDAAERHRGLGSIEGQRHQPLPLTTGEDYGEDLVGRHGARIVQKWSPSPALRPSDAVTARETVREPALAHQKEPDMRVDLLTKEYPPEIYGGAGVHAAELTKVLREHIDVRVRAFGAERDEEGTFSYTTPAELDGANASLSTLGTDLLIAADCGGADLIHSHTWYANFAGHIASLLHGAPHVLSAHSLEPLRPWKAEQLGGGYRVSSFAERTAYEGAAGVIAV